MPQTAIQSKPTAEGGPSAGPASPDADDPLGRSPSERDDDEPARQRGLVSLSDDRRLLRPDSRAWLSDRAGAALETLGLGGEARVRLVGDAEMADAHERHMNAPGTTDVITFDLGSAPGEIDADLLLCVDEAQRNAARLGIPVERELLLYLVHGVLHCAGYDDADEAGRARMHEREDEVLEAIGVGATFSLEGRGR